MRNSKLHGFERDKGIFRFFVILFDEMLNLTPTHPHVQWETQRYVVLDRKPRICWLSLVNGCLGRILAVNYFLSTRAREI